MNDYCYLNYMQVMIFMYEIRNMRINNKYFNDPIADSFQNYCVNRVNEIAVTPALLKKIPSYGKYKVTKNMVEYLSRLTGVDVFDKKTIKEYTPIIIDFENEAVSRVMEASEKIIEESKTR